MKEWHVNRQDLINDLRQENLELKAQNEYARSLIRSLLDNSDEYARQRAEEFLQKQETEPRALKITIRETTKGEKYGT